MTGGIPYCLVCGDDPTFNAFNVKACKGCNVFFDKFNMQSIKCNLDGGCLINKYIRKQCQACWLSKCLKMGMKKSELVDHPSVKGSEPTTNISVDTVKVQSKVTADDDLEVTLEKGKQLESVGKVTLEETDNSESVDDSDNDPTYETTKENESESDSDNGAEDTIFRRIKSVKKVLKPRLPKANLQPSLSLVHSHQSDVQIGEPHPIIISEHIQVDVPDPIIANDEGVDLENIEDVELENIEDVELENIEDVELENIENVLQFKSSCSSCGRNFRSLASLQKHEIKCSAGFVCQKCDVKFKTIKNLRSHIKTQHSEYNYVCEQCELRFKSSSKLKTHTKVHEDHTVVCPICGKVFKNKLVLKSHKYKKHGKVEPIKKKNLLCPICSKVYGSDRGLRFHMVLHKQLKKQFQNENSPEVAVVIERENINFPGEDVFITPAEIENETVSFLCGEEIVVVHIETEDAVIGEQEITVVGEVSVNVTEMLTDE